MSGLKDNEILVERFFFDFDVFLDLFFDLSVRDHSARKESGQHDCDLLIQLWNL